MTTATLLAAVLVEQGDVKLRSGARSEGKLTRQNADDCVSIAVKSQRLTDHIATAAISFLPGAVGKHHDLGAAGTVFAGKKIAPEYGFDTESAEEAVANAS